MVDYVIKHSLVTDHLDITLKMLDVNRIEANDSREQPDVSFSERFSEEIWSVRLLQDLFETVEGFEELVDSLLICLLSCGKPTLVDSIVDSVLNITKLVSMLLENITPDG